MGIDLNFDYSKYGFKTPEFYTVKFPKGLNEEIVRQISKVKGEPRWMEEFRLKAYRIYEEKPLPLWGADLRKIDFDDIIYYAKTADTKAYSWDDVPDYIKKTFDRLGIPEVERKFLAGLGAQYESEVIYQSLRKDLEKKGVIFVDMDTAVKEHGDIVKKHIGKVVPPSDNKFAALNSAVWSGGTFLYIPEGVKVDIPLQGYYRINAQSIGQFERTLIIAEPKSFVHYIEGCTAPVYSKDSLHASVVEVIVKEGANVKFTTIQNWSKNVYNLGTKRAHAYKDAKVNWIDGNIGSKVTMKYPAIYLLEEGAKAEVISVSIATKGQQQDSGGKVFHLAPNTSSRILAKSIVKDGGRTSYRGLVYVAKGAKNIVSNVRCDALILDDSSRTDTYPYMEVNEESATITHEASVGKISEDQLFYLMSRGISEVEAISMIVTGFIEPFIKELPMEFAVELNRIIQMEMEGAIA
jgi:Fe-S cluster assembly protein SufB